MQSELGALIVGYQRLAGIQKNMDLCVQNGIKNIYVSIDYPKITDNLSIRRHNEIIHYLHKKLLDGEINLFYRVAHKNVGSAINVITSCDWFFENNIFGVILEDDCIPNESFFHFVRENQRDLELDGRIWLISGTQFVPREIIASTRVLVKYPQIWGWATTNSKWAEIRGTYFGVGEKTWPSDIDSKEKAFWEAGEIRARKGYVDAWDIILAATMLKRQKYALVSNRNLVTNIGVDDVSTHTKKKSTWIAHPTSNLDQAQADIVLDENSSFWLKRNFYGIRARHLLSTKITRIFDLVRIKSRKPTSLILRLSAEFTYYSNSEKLS